MKDSDQKLTNEVEYAFRMLIAKSVTNDFSCPWFIEGVDSMDLTKALLQLQESFKDFHGAIEEIKKNEFRPSKPCDSGNLHLDLEKRLQYSVDSVMSRFKAAVEMVMLQMELAKLNGLERAVREIKDE